MRSKHYSPGTEESYAGWVRRHVRFHGMRHPAQLGSRDVNRFLSALAGLGRLSASSQTQALSALLFLYRDILGHDIGTISQVTRAKQPARLPVTLEDFWVRRFT